MLLGHRLSSAGEDRSGHPVRRGREVLGRPTARDVEASPGGIQGVVPGVAPRKGIHAHGL